MSLDLFPMETTKRQNFNSKKKREKMVKYKEQYFDLRSWYVELSSAQWSSQLKILLGMVMLHATYNGTVLRQICCITLIYALSQNCT